MGWTKGLGDERFQDPPLWGCDRASGRALIIPIPDQLPRSCDLKVMCLTDTYVDNNPADSFCCHVDLFVMDVCVSQRHRNLPMAKKPRYGR